MEREREGVTCVEKRDKRVRWRGREERERERGRDVGREGGREKGEKYHIAGHFVGKIFHQVSFKRIVEPFCQINSRRSAREANISKAHQKVHKENLFG